MALLNSRLAASNIFEMPTWFDEIFLGGPSEQPGAPSAWRRWLDEAITRDEVELAEADREIDTLLVIADRSLCALVARHDEAENRYVRRLAARLEIYLVRRHLHTRRIAYFLASLSAVDLMRIEYRMRPALTVRLIRDRLIELGDPRLERGLLANPKEPGTTTSAWIDDLRGRVAEARANPGA